MTDTIKVLTGIRKPIELKALRFDNLNLVLVYLNSLVFSALFTIDSIPAYLVRAVFNGSGIIMVAGLLSLVMGNLFAGIAPRNPIAIWGSYYATKFLFVLQCILLIVFTSAVIIKRI